MESSCLYDKILFVLVVLTAVQVCSVEAGNPTDGFISLPLDSSHLEIQRPYNLPVASRYKFVDGIHTLWVISTDKPHDPESHTMPRTEARVRGYDYDSGIWQFEGHAFVPKGTTAVSIMQIKDLDLDSTTLMLRVYNGALLHYPNAQVLASDIYDKWIRVNVIHYVAKEQIEVYLDGDLKLVETDHKGNIHYFKFGVYAQTGCSHYMESQWKGVKVLKLPE